MQNCYTLGDNSNVSERYSWSEPDKQQIILHVLAFVATYYKYNIKVEIWARYENFRYAWHAAG